MQNKGMFLRNIKDDNKAAPVGELRCRLDEVVIHRLRTGHVGLNQNLFRFGIVVSENCEYCQLPETIQHYLLECKQFQPERELMETELNRIGVRALNLKIILGGEPIYIKVTLNIFYILLKYIRSTGKIATL